MTTHPKSKLYTKTGDKGQTRLADGSCVEKFNPQVEAYGCVDELNSQIGLCLSLLQDVNAGLSSIKPDLTKLQHLLFNLGSQLAAKDPDILSKLPAITPEHIAWLEGRIDELDSQLEPLKNFILPGGSIFSSHFHIARSSCRRAERRTAEMESTLPEHQNCLIFLNRLSDYFFVLSRFTNKATGMSDVQWEKQ